MAQNVKGKALYIGSDEDEWPKVLENYFLSDLVLERFGDEPIAEYGSYTKMPKELRQKTLNWLRQQKYYYEEILGVTDEKQEAADTGLPEVDDLERRISKLEAVFKYLKKMKERDDAEINNSC